MPNLVSGAASGAGGGSSLLLPGSIWIQRRQEAVGGGERGGNGLACVACVPELMVGHLGSAWSLDLGCRGVVGFTVVTRSDLIRSG
jgi:hypothetical protein